MFDSRITATTKKFFFDLTNCKSKKEEWWPYYQHNSTEYEKETEMKRTDPITIRWTFLHPESSFSSFSGTIIQLLSLFIFFHSCLHINLLIKSNVALIYWFLRHLPSCQLPSSCVCAPLSSPLSPRNALLFLHLHLHLLLLLLLSYCCCSVLLLLLSYRNNLSKVSTQSLYDCGVNSL